MSGEWLNVEATYKCKQMLWQNLWLLLVRNHNVIREEEHLITQYTDFQPLLTSTKDALSFGYEAFPLGD